MDPGKAGCLVEFPLHPDDLPTDPAHIIRSPLSAQHPAALLHHSLQAGGYIQDGEGDEQAVAAGINEGGGILEIARHIRLFNDELIYLAAHPQHLRRDGVPGGVVGPHGGDGIGDADPLDGSWVVGRHGLTLDRGAAHHAEDPRRSRRTVAEYIPQWGALTDLMHQFDGFLPIAEVGQPRLHSDADGYPRLNGVQAVVVAEMNQLAGDVQVVDATVGPKGPDRLILLDGDQLAAIRVGIDVGTPDDTSRAASVAGRAHPTPLLTRLVDRLPTDPGRSLEASFTEIPGGEAAGLVDDVDQHRRTVAIQCATGLGEIVCPQCLHQLLAAGVEDLFVDDGHAGAVFVV